MNEKLTIIIPFLNEGAEVENTVNSILKHSNNDVNIIVINDGSDDEYNYQNLTSYKNVTYIYNEKRLGVAMSRDLGVELCNTDYFLLLDAHMRFYSNDWVEYISKELKKEPKSLLCCQTKSLKYINEELVENPFGFAPFGAYIEFNEIFTFLEPKWIHKGENIIDEENNNPIIQIPCILGAGYACSKEYWKYLNGLEGLLYYGSDEPFLSMKVWLSGGKCKLLRDIAIGHIYRENAPYNHNSLSRVYNRLLIAFLLFPPSLKKKTFSLENFKDPSIFYQANHLLLKNIDANILKREYFSSIIQHDFSDFKKFNDSKISLKPETKRKKDTLLIEIVNFLLSNFSEIDDIGILNGKMGSVIFLYHYYKYSNNKVFSKLSETFFEKIQEKITENTPLNFASGIAGIGWGLEYLYQNKLINVDTNDILFEIDRKIMEINPFRSTNCNLHYGMGGIIRYLLSRLYTITNDRKTNPFINNGFLSDIYSFSKNVVNNTIVIDCIDTYIDFILFFESKQKIAPAVIYDIDYPKMLDIKKRKFYQYKNTEMKHVIGFGIELIIA
ncbi:MAG: glycosyltransferase [Porphyromonadaceae bacterium]|nr:glycosyltransferase [Porphyromonadaceae bacterium]